MDTDTRFRALEGRTAASHMRLISDEEAGKIVPKKSFDEIMRDALGPWLERREFEETFKPFLEQAAERLDADARQAQVEGRESLAAFLDGRRWQTLALLKDLMKWTGHAQDEPRRKE